MSTASPSGLPLGHAAISSDGTYRLVGLGPGDYRVKFDSCEQVGSDTYGLQYYRAAKRPGDATTVTVPSGGERTGVDATLEPGTSISGHVYGSSGTDAPLAGACVSVAVPSPDTGGVTFERRVSTDAAGAYAVHGLAAGVDYRVQFDRCNASGSAAYTSEWYDGQPSPQTAKAVTPTIASPAVGIDAHLGPAGSGGSPGAPAPGGTTGGQTTRPPATAPAITLSKLRAGKLGTVLRSGLKLPLSCSRSCDLAVKVTVAGRTAKKLHLAKKATETVVGSAGGKGTTARKNLRVRFAAKARKALGKVRSVRLVVTVVARDGTGPKRTTKRALILKR
ncbi:carboxypeptidase-like regulatory domain-containing protein [Patulibacter sp. NPDC049589]|uniref:carboxypeptidase-like regulatory domain-containing protein n=1 Tax=Patulibacter sp. NPDC049589 TaxID=3154731 RepID=UPI0034179771